MGGVSDVVIEEVETDEGWQGNHRRKALFIYASLRLVFPEAEHNLLPAVNDAMRGHTGLYEQRWPNFERAPSFV
jgi:hypothetical protein